MYLLPRLELEDGECRFAFTRPSQGEALSVVDPVEVAKRFQGMGAQGFHVVDLDHSKSPKKNNDKALLRIVETTKLPIQAGGGVRSLRRIQELLDTGCARVIVGTMGVLHEDWLREAALCFPERLVAGLDARDGQLVINGRTEPVEKRLDAFASRIDGYGLESLHIAAIDAAANGSSLPRLASLATSLKTPMTVEGPIRSEADLALLERAGVRGVSLGQEIYDGTLAFERLVKAYRVR